MLPEGVDKSQGVIIPLLAVTFEGAYLLEK